VVDLKKYSCEQLRKCVEWATKNDMPELAQACLEAAASPAKRCEWAVRR